MPWRSHLIWFVLAFASVNGVLYALLLPLWEGFDEAFHYGYVQEFSTGRGLPVMGKTTLSQEIWDSILLEPVSHVVQHNIPAARTYSSYFAMSAAQRSDLRGQLATISPAEKHQAAVEHANYEAHQAPLAYLVLAIPDRLLSDQSLLVRIRVLRILCVLAAILLTAGAAFALCSQLKIPAPYPDAVLFLTFSSQMFYATTAHICNDWLAVPLASWLIVMAIRVYLRPAVGSACGLALVLALGLLTKGYFLAFVPLSAGIFLIAFARRRLTLHAIIAAALIVVVFAGPWYARNLRLYRSVSAMPESVAGIGISEVVRATPGVPWMASIGYMARASLWTGNNQFNTFSRGTLNFALFLLFVGGCYYLSRRHAATDIVTLSAILSFVLAIAYSTVVSFLYTRGASAGASPWYMQALLLPVVATVILGLSGRGFLARLVAGANVLLWAYVMLVTYVVKLIPQYGGYEVAHGVGIFNWYFQDGVQRNEILSSTTLAPPGLIYGLVGAVGILGVLISVTLCMVCLRPAPE